MLQANFDKSKQKTTESIKKRDKGRTFDRSKRNQRRNLHRQEKDTSESQEHRFEDLGMLRERWTPMSEENYNYYRFKKSSDAKEMMIRMVGTIFYDLILVEN